MRVQNHERSAVNNIRSLTRRSTGVAYDVFGEKIGARQIPAGISEVALPRGVSLVVRE